MLNEIEQLIKEDEEATLDYEDTMILLEEEGEILPYRTANEYTEDIYLEGQML